MASARKDFAPAAAPGPQPSAYEDNIRLLLISGASRLRADAVEIVKLSKSGTFYFYHSSCSRLYFTTEAHWLPGSRDSAMPAWHFERMRPLSFYLAINQPEYPLMPTKLSPRTRWSRVTTVNSYYYLSTFISSLSLQLLIRLQVMLSPQDP